MVRRRIDRQLIDRLSAEWEPQMRNAFLQSVDQVRTNARIGDIARALERGEIETALELVGIDARDFRPMIRTLEQAYEAGGQGTATAIQRAAPPGLRFVSRFDVRNLRAEQWLAERSSMLITEIVSDQRNMIRNMLTDGMVRGQNPRNVALDLVGRINKVTGNREGGVLGLTSRLEEAARGYAADLASGDPTRMRNALRLQLRDRRFDRSVLKAIREGEKLPSDLLSRMVQQYRNRALRYRAETIARTEMLGALNSARDEAFRQVIEDGHIAEGDVRRYWKTAGDERVRDAHRLIPGMNPNGVGLNEAFQTPDGPYTNPPAGPNCRCTVDVDIDFLASAVAA